MAILACAQFTASHATKYHSFGYSSARVSGFLFDVRNGPDEVDQVFSVDYNGATILGAGATYSGDVIIGDTYGLVVGHSAQLAMADNTPEIQVIGTAGPDTTMTFGRWSADASGPTLRFYKSRNATVDSNTAVTSGDQIGMIRAYGDDGTDHNTKSSAIIFRTEGTISTGQVPGVIAFQVAAAGTLADAVTIDSAKKMSVVGAFDVSGATTLVNTTVVGNFSQNTGTTTVSTMVMTANATVAGTLGVTGVSNLSTTTVSELDWIWFDGGGNTGIRESASDVLTFQVGGAEMLVLTESTTDTFAVIGNVTITGDGTGSTVATFTGYDLVTDTQLSLWERTGSAVQADLKWITSSNNIEFGTVTAHTLVVKTNDTAALTITSGQAATFAGTLAVTGAITATAEILAKDGAVGAPSYTFTNSPTMGMYRIGSNTLGFATSGVQRMMFNNAGWVGINDDANAGMTMGLTIQQDGNSDEIVSFKSFGSVAHGVTTLAETDTFAMFKKVHGATGGLHIFAFRETSGGTGYNFLTLDVIGTDYDTTKSAAGRAAIELTNRKASGTSTTGPDANANLVAVNRWGNGTAVWIVDEDGDTWQSGGIIIPTLSKLYFDDGDNTYITESAADQMQFVTAGGEALKLTSNSTLVGRNMYIANGQGLTIGSASQLSFGEITSEFQIQGTAAADSTMSVGRWSANANPANLIFYKSRNATIGSNTAVTTGDTIAQISAYGDDGTDDDTISSAILFATEGTIGTGQVPGKIVFQVAAAGTLATALTIDSAKAIFTQGPLVLPAAEAIRFDGSASGDTYIYEASANVLDFIVGGNQVLRLTSGDVYVPNSRGLVVGAIAPVTIDGVSAEFQVLGTGSADTNVILARWGASASPASISFFKSRNATIGSSTAVTTGDNIGQITALGDDGTDFNTLSSAIVFDTEGTISTGQVPGKIVFQTAAAGTLADALTIDKNGQVWIEATKNFYLDGGGNTYISEPSADRIALTAGGTIGLIVRANDISLGAPTDKLYLDGLGDTYLHESSADVFQVVTGGGARMSIGTASISFTSIDVNISATKNLFLDGGGDTYLTESSANVMRLYTGGVIAMTWDASQDVQIANGGLTVSEDSSYTLNLGIGQAAPTLERLGVEESAAAGRIATFRHTHASGALGIRIDYSVDTPNDTGSIFILAEDASATRFALRSNGGILNYQSNDADLSDERLKTKYGRVGSTWEQTKAIEIWNYRYNENLGSRMMRGAMAQQVGVLSPHLFDEKGWDDGTHHSLFNKDLWFDNMRTLQEAQVRIEKLERKVFA